MEPIERNFYQQAKVEAIIEEINETEEDREDMIAFLNFLKEDKEANPKQPDPEKIKWFEDLAEGVIEFAKNCYLDLRMRISEEYIGSIIFETSYFELTAFDDLVVRKFWLYLCQRGRFTITHKEEAFSMEFQFDLSVRE